MKLYFVRHGESTDNKDERFTGERDVDLTDLGREQAMSAGKKIADQGWRPDIIISSPKLRTFDTARLIALQIDYPESEIIKEPLITERFFGSIQGKLKKEVGQLTEEIIRASGAENDEQMEARAKQFVELLKSRDVNTVLVVSHNGFGKRLRAVIEGLPSGGAWTLPDFVNAELVELAEI